MDEAWYIVMAIAIIVFFVCVVVVISELTESKYEKCIDACRTFDGIDGLREMMCIGDCVNVLECGGGE